MLGVCMLACLVPTRRALPAIEGKTWNHPAISDGILLIRNIEEMAAFDLRR